MTKMKLNKYQYAWIRKLKSGKTRKTRLALNNGKGQHCCLGVGINVCGLEYIGSTKNRSGESLEEFPKTLEALGLKDTNGGFDTSRVSEKWKKKIGNSFCLMGLNDDYNLDLSHKEIGEFIDENREAVFKK